MKFSLILTILTTLLLANIHCESFFDGFGGLLDADAPELELPQALDAPEIKIPVDFSKTFKTNELMQKLHATAGLESFLQTHQYTIDGLAKKIQMLFAKQEHHEVFDLNSNSQQKHSLLNISWKEESANRVHLTIQGAEATMNLPTLHHHELIKHRHRFMGVMLSPTYSHEYPVRGYTDVELERIKEHMKNSIVKRLGEK